MKHPQYILAFDKEAFGRDVATSDGFIRMEFGAFIERAQKALFVGRRHELETNERFGQLLPYIMVRQQGKTFVYRRTKMVGEQRLAGMASVGIGGHVDLVDVCANHDSVIDFMATLAVAVGRELFEELIFVEADGKEWDVQKFRAAGIHPTPKFLGVINDMSNEVGRVHYGAVFTLEVPTEYTVKCKEAELETVGFVDNFDGYELESWSAILRREVLEK